MTMDGFTLFIRSFEEGYFVRLIACKNMISLIHMVTIHRNSLNYVRFLEMKRSKNILIN